MQRPTVVELFERHHGAVYRYFRRLTGRREPAEDLTQELFVQVLQALPAYEPREREIAWLFRIARNLWIDRSCGRRKYGDYARTNHTYLTRNQEIAQLVTSWLVRCVTASAPDETSAAD